MNDGAHCAQKTILHDLEDTGLVKTRILLKTDQGPALVCAQRAIQDFKPEIISINSPVGESACNGRVEDAVWRVQGKMRILRHQLGRGIVQNIPDQSVIMAWMAKWAAELISKHPPGEDGTIPYERIRQERCQVPLVPLGEIVMYSLVKTVATNNGVPARRPGVWLGITERTEETIIGTSSGALKCRTVSRMTNGQPWNGEIILQLRGLPWEPVPGKQSMPIFVDVDDNGEDPQGYRGREVRPTEALDGDALAEARGSSDKLHISRKAITKYGTTIGCPGCGELAGRGQQSGKINYNHSGEC